MDNKKLIYYGAVHSIGVAAYVALVAWFMNHAQNFFGKANTVLGGATILLILVFSALVTGSLVLGKPVMYYLDGKKAEAVKLLFFTMASLFILLLLAIAGLILLK